MNTFTVKELTPIFKCRVEKNKLTTNGEWYSTARPGDKYIILATNPMNEGQFLFKKKFNKDLYFKNLDEEFLSIKKDDIRLAVNEDTMFGQDEITCILIGSRMDDLE